MNQQTKSFIEDLKALCDKHKVFLDAGDNYGSDEQYLGTEYAFIGAQDSVGDFKIWLKVAELEKHI